MPGIYLKYGEIQKPRVPVAMAAGQVIGNQSGHFVYMDDGAATLCVDGVAYIFGWVESHAHTPTIGDLLNCNISLDTVYRIPIDTGTFVTGMIGDDCDLDVSDSVQGAKLDTHNEGHVIVVGGINNGTDWVDVKINPVAQGATVGTDET